MVRSTKSALDYLAKGNSAFPRSPLPFPPSKTRTLLKIKMKKSKSRIKGERGNGFYKYTPLGPKTTFITAKPPPIPPFPRSPLIHYYYKIYI